MLRYCNNSTVLPSNTSRPSMLLNGGLRATKKGKKACRSNISAHPRHSTRLVSCRWQYLLKSRLAPMSALLRRGTLVGRSQHCVMSLVQACTVLGFGLWVVVCRATPWFSSLIRCALRAVLEAVHRKHSGGIVHGTAVCSNKQGYAEALLCHAGTRLEQMMFAGLFASSPRPDHWSP